MKYRPEYNLLVIGKNLKRLRESKELSVKDVQEYLMLGSVQAIYKYENGKGYPQADTMLALMELYGASLSDVVCEYKVVTKASCERNAAIDYITWVNSIVRFGIYIDITNIGIPRYNQHKRLLQYMILFQEDDGKGNLLATDLDVKCCDFIRH